ncbi:MAG: hypothetical protein PHI37_02785 [Candidatus Gracilibacteria bacterium]|nr:hypothetical protein [Candidatus Gracilibacteria bacterium]
MVQISESFEGDDTIKKGLSGDRYPLKDENVIDTTRILTSGNQIYFDGNGTLYDEESALKAGIDLKTLKLMDSGTIPDEFV